MTSRITTLALGVAAITFGSCNSRNPIIDASVPTVPSSVVGTAPVPVSTVVSVIVDPSAVFGGSATTGRVLLSFPAPSSGLAVALSSSNPAMSVPASITVPQGADSAPFTIQTLPSQSDISASITASEGGRAVDAPLAVWAKTPPFIASWTDRGNGQRIVAERINLASQMRASCGASVVDLGGNTTSTFYAIVFAAPQRTAIKPGTYENARTGSVQSPTQPLLDISSTSFRSCSAPQISRFVVSEVELIDDLRGTVRRFTATFEQQCGTATIRGEVNVAGVAAPNNSHDPCILP